MGLTLDALRPRSDAGRERRSGGERRRSSALGDSLGGIDSGGAATRGAAVVRPHRRTAQVKKAQLAQGA